jgi:hypothetical protein
MTTTLPLALSVAAERASELEAAATSHRLVRQVRLSRRTRRATPRVADVITR